VRAIPAPAPRELAAALEDFEIRFSYPLGEHAKFRISHGEDYARFFRAIGESVVLVAERDGEVMGTLGGALRGLGAPDGREAQVLYIGDLKVLPGIEAGLTLLKLAGAMRAWAEKRVAAAFGVAMDGTRKTPERYTGRFGIPEFAPVGKIMVLRLACDTEARGARSRSCTKEEGLSLYRSLSRGCYAAVGGAPQERSAIEPSWTMLKSRMACGMLEDTRKAKRLFTVGGGELVSAHLSYFAFEDPGSGADFLLEVVAEAATLGFPALFCAVPFERTEALVAALGSMRPSLAPATIYAAGIAKGAAWHMNTSEI
jgi:hypothetical protein